MAKTGNRTSGLAGRYIHISGKDIRIAIGNGEEDVLAADIRSMAASLLRQDEHRGLRGLVRKIVGG